MFRISNSIVYREKPSHSLKTRPLGLALALAVPLFLAACGSNDNSGGPRSQPNDARMDEYMGQLGWYDYGPDPQVAGQGIERPTQTAPVEYAALPEVGQKYRSADDGAAVAASQSDESVAALAPYDTSEPGAEGYYADSSGNARLAPAYQQQSYKNLPTFGAARPASGKARVAILVPLSGPHRGVGEALLHAAEMSLFSMGGDDIELMPRDTKGTQDGAAQAARQAISDGAELIIGPLFASSVAAVGPIAQQSQVTVLAFSNDRSVAAPGVFLLGFLPEQQVARIVRFSHRKGLRRFAALFPQTAYGERVERAFNFAVRDIGSQVVATASYEPIPEAMFDPVRKLAAYDRRSAALDAERASLENGDDAFSAAARARLSGQESIGSAGFDAVLLPEGGNNLRSLAPLLPYYDIDPKEVRFLGTGLWGEPGLGLEPSLQGGWYAGPPPDVGEAFMVRYKALYGNQPPRLVTMAFDAVALAATLAKQGGSYRFAPRAFVRPEGFAGLDGIFRLHRDGLNERGLAIVEILPKGVRVIDPAPTEFGSYEADWQREMVDERQRTRFPQSSGGDGYIN